MFVYRCVSVKRVSDLERHRESFVAPPVRRQHWAQKVGAVRPHELGGVVRDDLHHRPVVVLSESRHRGVLLLLRIAHLPHHRLKAAGRRTEPAAGARIYRNTHHNNVSKGKGTSNRHQTQSFRFKIDGICLCKNPFGAFQKAEKLDKLGSPQALRASSTGESRGRKETRGSSWLRSEETPTSFTRRFCFSFAVTNVKIRNKSEALRITRGERVRFLALLKTRHL